jgi:tagatose 6-phosphate kinase
VIVTITLNPALQVDYEAEKVEAGAFNPIGGVRHAAAGGGLTVARLLTQFGHEVVAAGLAGGSTGELIRNELAQAGVAAQFTRTGAESRRVVRVSDGSSGEVTAFAEPAPYITTEELGRLAADYRNLLDGADAVVLCGSLPAGLPDDIYGSLTSYAAGAGVPVVLSGRGSVLRFGAARGPALVLPELPADAAEQAAAAAELRAAGAQAVAVAGANGVQIVSAGSQWQAALRASAPAGRVLAHDGLVTGFVPGIALGWSWPDMLRNAVALAASVAADGEADLGAYETLLSGVSVSRRAGSGAGR